MTDDERAAYLDELRKALAQWDRYAQPGPLADAARALLRADGQVEVER